MRLEPPMQLADCKRGTVVLYSREIRKRLSPAFTVYALIQLDGGPQGMTVTVGTGGTYRSDPAVTGLFPKQLPMLKLSAVVLYRSAME